MTDIVAFIVAVEKCGQTGWNLPGAHAKALDMARHLLDLGTKPEDVFLFIRIDEAEPNLRTLIAELKIKVLPPTWDRIDTEFNLLHKGRKNGSRLFCYWYGHGYADTKGNRLLVCEDFDLDNFAHRVFNATNRLRRLHSGEYGRFGQQIFLADVCGQPPRRALGLDEMDVGEVRHASRQLAFFATREGGYSDGTFSTVVLDLLKGAKVWVEPNDLFEKLIGSLEKANIEPYVVFAFDEGQKIDGRCFGEVEEDAIQVQVPTRDVFDRNEVLIGRQAELSVFKRSFAALTRQLGEEAPRVLLIQGEGGMGKSSLLRKFSTECQTSEETIDWMYTDWEVSGITAKDGTPRMMAYLACQLKAACGMKFPVFEKTHRELFERRTSGMPRDEGPSGDELGVERRSLRLSQALMADLAAAASVKPIVLLFDTFEVVQGFADSWVRSGLLKTFLIDPKLRNRILLVIAGRFADDDRLSYKDDTRKYYGFEGALYDKILDRLSPGEIQEYARAKFERYIGDETARQIYRYTSGFPLGVTTLLNEVEQGALKENEIVNLKGGGAPSFVTAELAKRFLKHVEKDQKERKRIISFITMRPNEGGQIFDRLNLLKLLWERLQLARDVSEFDAEQQALKGRYSFLLSNGLIRPEVWRYLSDWALGSDFEPTLTMDVCEQAYRICTTELESRECKLREWHDHERYEAAKYRDAIWQNWLLDKIHYGIWLNNVDEAVGLILNHYVTALGYRFVDFAKRLISLCSEGSSLYGRLDLQHRKLLVQLKALDSGLADEQMRAARRQLRQSLNLKAALALHVQGIKFYARKGEFDKAISEADLAERTAGELGSTGNAGLERELGRALLLLGERLSTSTDLKSVQFRAKEILERARRWIESDAQLRCAFGDVYLKLDWLDDARSWFLSAGDEANTRAGTGLQRVRAREAVAGKQTVVAFKLARLYTAQASALCAEAKFEDAKRKIRCAIEVVPHYLPAKIRRCHILRIEGDAVQSDQELETIEATEDVPSEWKASLLDARGATYLALDRLDDAEGAYRQALEISPEYMNALHGLGRVHLARKQHVDAIAHFRNVVDVKRRITKKTGNASASLYWVYIGLGLAHVVGGDAMDADNAFMIAENLCDRDLQSRGGCRHFQLWTNKVVALLGQKQYSKAADAILQLSSLPSTSRAKGMYRAFSLEVNVLANSDSSVEFRKVANTINLL